MITFSVYSVSCGIHLHAIIMEHIVFLFLPPLVLPLSIKEFFCQFDFARRMLPPSLSSPE